MHLSLFFSWNNELLGLTIKGTINVPKVAKENGVRRVVVTSLSSSIMPSPNWLGDMIKNEVTLSTTNKAKWVLTFLDYNVVYFVGFVVVICYCIRCKKLQPRKLRGSFQRTRVWMWWRWWIRAQLWVRYSQWC